MEKKKKGGFWDLNLRIAGSMNCVVPLMATWLHCSELYGDQPDRIYLNAGKREWEWQWLVFSVFVVKAPWFSIQDQASVLAPAIH